MPLMLFVDSDEYFPCFIAREQTCQFVHMWIYVCFVLLIVIENKNGA